MSDLALSLVFAASAAVSLGSSWVLVSRLERVGARLGLSEALLGMVAALAANAPEITAAVTALATGQSRIGAGVVLGSNVFNLAALLGFAAVVAGRIALHRRVIELEGAVASCVAVVAVVVVVGAISAGAGLALALAVVLPYLVALGVRHDRLRRLGLPHSWLVWLTRAIEEEGLELEPAIHPRRGRRLDAARALAAVLVVIGASVAMERSASTLGAHLALSEIVLGAVILAGVTSLPNAVAAVLSRTAGSCDRNLEHGAQQQHAQCDRWAAAAGNSRGLERVLGIHDACGGVVPRLDAACPCHRLRQSRAAAPSRSAHHRRVLRLCRRAGGDVSLNACCGCRRSWAGSRFATRRAIG